MTIEMRPDRITVKERAHTGPCGHVATVAHVATVELQRAADGSIMAGNLKSSGNQACLETLIRIAFKRQMYFVVNDDDPHRKGLERLYRIFGAIYTGKVYRTQL